MRRTYDANGNQTSETDARGHTEYFGYDAENRQSLRIDREGGVWRTQWNAYGDRLAETDANGRVTTWAIGAFGQIVGTSMAFGPAGYVSAAQLAGAATGVTSAGDWLAVIRALVQQSRGASTWLSPLSCSHAEYPYPPNSTQR